MQLSDSPTLVPLPFADSGSKNVIPEAASPTPGLASLTTGFPPVTMTPLAAGGIPPAGQDMNGILNLITQSTRWAQGGGPYAYNSAFATDSNVNGYPQGAVILRADYTGQWISTADNNTVNPDTVGTNWVPGYNYGVTAIAGLTNANVTLTPAQAAKNRITLAGTLTGNVQIIFPVWTKDWTVVNNTTGAFTVTCKTSAGTGIAIPQDASPTKITGDGTNITQPAENVPPATASNHAVQLGQVSGVVGQVRNLVMSVTTASATATLTADEIVVETALGGLRYCLPSFSKTINLATTGAGGMDTGTAPTSGYVGIYAIYNPTTQTAALLAQAEGAGAEPSIYGGANMPAGYTASSLVSVWPTNASKLFVIGAQRDRHINILPVAALTNASGSLTPASFSIAGAVPKSAVRYYANSAMGVGSGTNSCSFYTCATAGGAGIGPVAGINNPTQSASGGSSPTDIITPQTSFYVFGGTGVQTPTSNSLGINGYDF